MTSSSLPPQAPGNQSGKPTQGAVRESVRVLLNFIPQQNKDEEHSSSAMQRRMLEEIRWAVIDANADNKDASNIEEFDAIMIKQERLIQEIQKRTRMLVGV